MNTLNTTKSHLLTSVTDMSAKWDKSLSYRCIVRYLKCPKSFYKLLGKRDERGTEFSEVLGETVHEAVTHTTEEAQEKAIEKFVASIPAGEKRNEFKKVAKDFIKTAVRLRTPGIVEQWKERKLKVRLEGTDYVLVTKPDEVNLVKLQNGDEYIEVVDYKTGRIGASAEDQLFLAGLVVALLARQNGWVGNIKLVARSLATGEQQDWNFSRIAMKRDLEQLTAIFEEIEENLVNGIGFEYNVSSNCERLACRFDCKKFKQAARANAPELDSQGPRRSWRRFTDNRTSAYQRSGFTNRFQANSVSAAA
jgi:RecB family exonuclease